MVDGVDISQTLGVDSSPVARSGNRSRNDVEKKAFTFMVVSFPFVGFSLWYNVQREVRDLSRYLGRLVRCSFRFDIINTSCRKREETSLIPRLRCRPII